VIKIKGNVLREKLDQVYVIKDDGEEEKNKQETKKNE